MYSLGCLIHAVHLKGEPPFKNFDNLGSVREHAGRPLSGITRLDRDLQGMSHFQLPVRAAEWGLSFSNARFSDYSASAEPTDTQCSPISRVFLVIADIDPQLLRSVQLCCKVERGENIIHEGTY